MGSIPKMKSTYITLPTQESSEVQEAAAAYEQEMKRRKKRSAMIQTTPEGVSQEPATLKTKLGE